LDNKVKLGWAYCRIMESLHSYSEFNKIPIKRAREVISRIHRMHKPYCTRIISELDLAGWIKLTNGSGNIELIK
jgi:hypothetical protein